ncbi:hypothetical protein FSP39_002734 [Pinctada imbricata]|uniref:Meckel syndrome type 1 protein n=1 Tax=Pinctada imbricata TaxID=66713 RepID=A0AA88XE74_PINIB|nr:hypothetical protein FSP39_002734 [Pinctada imbricata]
MISNNIFYLVKLIIRVRHDTTGIKRASALSLQIQAPCLYVMIKLSRISSSNIVSSSEEKGSDVELKQKAAEQSADKLEEKIFSWQQKVEKDGERQSRLFTYIDQDDFCHQDEAVFYMTNSPKEKQTVLAEKMAHLRRRKIGTDKKATEGNAFIPKLNIIDQRPSDELRDKNHVMSTPSQIMYIMADLSPSDRASTPADEVILCSVQLDANGVVCIRPDFNRGRRPYIAETASLGREVFEYTIEHASKVMNRQEADKEVKMYREMYSRHKDFLQACVGQEFEPIPPDVLRLMVYGEIESARNFEYDHLYLHFFVDLPKHWTARRLDGRHQQLSWVTHTCATKVEGRDEVAHYSFPFKFELFYKNESYDEEEREMLPKFPLIMIEVLSLDSWNRFRTEGYTYLTVPAKPGVFKERAHCWRPIGTSVISELRRFFIGGSPELEDPTYTAIPSTFEGSNLSKFGFRTETTGSVDVNLNVIMQSKAFMEKRASKKSLGSLLDTLGISAMQANISNVLEAFKKARQRMMQARENATKELMKDSVHKDALFSKS